MDLKDKKIIYELDKNSRVSYSLLAKKIGLSKEVTFQRLNKFRKDFEFTKVDRQGSYRFFNVSKKAN